MRSISERATFDPMLRSSIELLDGPSPAEPGQVRGKTVRGKARHSPQAALEAAINDILPRLDPELRDLARRRPGCQFIHGPLSSPPHCPDPGCQAWIDEIVAWHTARFGPRFSYVTYNAVGWMSRGRSLSRGVHDERSRDVLDPTTIAFDVLVDRQWVTTNVGIHATATKADLHDLVDRLWPEVEGLRRRSGQSTEEQPRSNGRGGRLDRPARATYWRLRQFQGLSFREILEEWVDLTLGWSQLGEGQVDRDRLEYPAWIEWKRRGAAAGVERFDEIGSIQRAIAKLRNLNA